MQREEHLVSQLPSNGCSSSCVNNLLMCTLSERHTQTGTYTHMHAPHGEHALLIFAGAPRLKRAGSSRRVQCTVRRTPFISPISWKSRATSSHLSLPPRSGCVNHVLADRALRALFLCYFFSPPSFPHLLARTAVT